MYKEIEAKAVFYKAIQELKINFDYETEKYGICHISLNLRVTTFKPKETIEWKVCSINLQWEKYKKSPDNRNLFLYHYILNKLTEDNAYMLRRTTYQYGGKRTVQPVIVIDKGKGLGKARKTVSEQAEIEFNSHIKKYLDKGYKQLPLPIDNYTKDQLEEFLPDEVTDSNGNLKPMLALDYHKVASSVLEKHCIIEKKFQ